MQLTFPKVPAGNILLPDMISVGPNAGIIVSLEQIAPQRVFLASNESVPWHNAENFVLFFKCVDF